MIGFSVAFASALNILIPFAVNDTGFLNTWRLALGSARGGGVDAHSGRGSAFYGDDVLWISVSVYPSALLPVVKGRATEKKSIEKNPTPIEPLAVGPVLLTSVTSVGVVDVVVGVALWTLELFVTEKPLKEAIHCRRSATTQPQTRCHRSSVCGCSR